MPDQQRNPRAILLLVFVLVTSIGCDQITKEVASRYLRSSESISLLGDTIRLRYTENPGAFLGLGSSLSPAVQFSLFTVLNGVVVALLSIILVVKRDMGMTGLCAFALLLGGGMGNLIDRLLHGGLVIDFLNLGIGPLRTGIFNVADLALMSGMALLIYALSTRPTRRPEPGTSLTESTPEP